MGRVQIRPIVVGQESIRVQLGYGGLLVVHSERKFQSHPTVPPGRLIEDLGSGAKSGEAAIVIEEGHGL